MAKEKLEEVVVEEAVEEVAEETTQTVKKPKKGYTVEDLKGAKKIFAVSLGNKNREGTVINEFSELKKGGDWMVQAVEFAEKKNCTLEIVK